MSRLDFSNVTASAIKKAQPMEISFKDICAICELEVRNDLCKIDARIGSLAFVGSSYIKQELTNDLDILIHMSSEDILKLSAECQSLIDWCEGGSFDNEDLSDKTPAFRSYRFVVCAGNLTIDVNVIAVNTREEFNRFTQAADICRLLQFCNKDIPKDLRIDIHAMLRHNMSFNELMEEKGLE